MFTAVTRFVAQDIWEIRLKELSPLRAFLVKDLRVVVMALSGFLRDRCLLRASALTYYSLLSIVPIFALVFGIAKGFGLELFVRNQILDLAGRANWPPHVIQRYVRFAGELLETTKGGVVAGIGVVLLLWTSISILNNMEDAFNEIWRVRKARSTMRKFTDYLAILIIAPMLIVISSSLNVLVVSKVEAILNRIALLGAISPYIIILLTFLPYLSIWALLVLNYMVIPNTRVKLRSAIVAGVATGTTFQIIQWIYITFQIGVSRKGAIYGSFAAMPLFLAWLQLSWMIVLFGAEVAVAEDNSETFGFHPDFERLSVASKKILALQVLHRIVKRFVRGESPQGVNEISRALEIPARFVRQLLDHLVTAKLIVETARNGSEPPAFQPGQPTETLTIQLAIQAFEQRGYNPSHLNSSEEEKIASYIKAISAEMVSSPNNVLLKEI